METRKVQKVGGGTFLISLPKAWARRNGIREGSLLSVEVGFDDILLLSGLEEGTKEAKEVTINYPREDLAIIVNEITGSYLLGYDLIAVRGGGMIAYEDREVLKKSIKQLAGLEIVEEDSSSITAQFLIDPASLDPTKLFRRMHILVEGMYRDAINLLAEPTPLLGRAIVERDEEVDRLYFLLVRLIRSATLYPKLAGKYGLSPIQCLDYRVAANLLESIGDAAVEIAKMILEVTPGALSAGIVTAIRGLESGLEKMQDLAIRAFESRSPGDARKVAKLYSNLSDSLDGLKAKAADGKSSSVSEVTGILNCMDRISRCCVDVADLASTLFPMVR